MFDNISYKVVGSDIKSQQDFLRQQFSGSAFAFRTNCRVAHLLVKESEPFRG
jgi:hypothetical protein